MNARAPRHSAASSPIPGAIAVVSGKGGVGKTWFSLTLAHAFAQHAPTLLFDGDLGLANIDVQLGLPAGRDLSAAATGQRSLAEVVTVNEQTGIHIIAGQSGSTTLATIQGRRLDALLHQLQGVAREYTHTVLDLGAGVDNTVRTLAGQAETIAVVLTEEPTSLTDAYAFIKLSHMRTPNSNIQIVVNQARNQNQGERTHQILARACQDFLQFSPPLLGVIRQDHHVPDTIRAQAPLLTRSPHSDAAQDVRAIAAKITH